MTDPAGAHGAQSSRAEDVPKRYPAEPQDLMNFLGRTVANQQLNVVLRLRGSAGRGPPAARPAAQSRPAARSRLPVSWRIPSAPSGNDGVTSTRWTCAPSLSAAPPTRRRNSGASSPAPTDPRHDLPVRAALLRGSSDTLCVKVDHVAADATATRQYIALLARAPQAVEWGGEATSSLSRAAAPDRSSSVHPLWR